MDELRITRVMILRTVCTILVHATKSEIPMLNSYSKQSSGEINHQILDFLYIRLSG